MKTFRVTYIFPINKRLGRVADSFAIPNCADEETAKILFKNISTFNGTGMIKEVATILKVEEIEMVKTI